MIAAPTPPHRRGQVTPQDHTVCDTTVMLGLVNLTANLEGKASHIPHQTKPPPPLH